MAHVVLMTRLSRKLGRGPVPEERSAQMSWSPVDGWYLEHFRYEVGFPLQESKRGVVLIKAALCGACV